MQLRPYQETCVNKAMDFLRKSVEPCMVDAAPAAGKSFMIASISDRLHQISGGKKVLNLAPSKELVTQNHAKMLMTGHPASIFSASAGSKSTRHNIVFGTPGTVKNNIRRFMSGYCAVNVDECHGITPTIKTIIDAMREGNPNLRVIGWSGTPFRLNTGYIFRLFPNGKPVPEDQTKDPYFAQCVHRVSAKEMLDAGFLCPMTVGAPLSDGYDAAGLKPNRMGKFNPTDLHSVFVGHGRLTAAVVGDVVEQSRNRYGGCMLFAATVEHCYEIMASLPPSNSGFVTGDNAEACGGTVKGRDAVIAAYRDRRFKYLVSVGTLTTGFDVEHTSTIATLRKTESAALLQQILGRAWRVDPQKENALWLDYANNCDEHFPDGDIYEPEIKAGYGTESSGVISAKCPMCDAVNEFSARQNQDGFDVTPHGYFADLQGEQIETEHGPMPAHFGRRCTNLLPIGGGRLGQCQYRWTSKECGACGAANDIAARRCCECKAEIVDPNSALDISFRELKKDPYKTQCDEVIKWEIRESVSRSGNDTYRIDATTPYRSFSVWILKQPKNSQAMQQLELLKSLKGKPPNTVKYVKEQSGFFRMLSFNSDPDVNEANQDLLKYTA